SAAVRRGETAAAADRISRVATAHLYATDEQMHAASVWYRAQAARTLTRARIGVVIVILLLLALFVWFYVGALRGRRRAERLEREREQLFHRAADAAEDEQRRLAADLHDGPIQQLTTIALTLDLAEMRGTGDRTAVLQEARAHVGEQIEALRQLMVELRPPALDTVGLVGALRDYLARYEERTGVATELVADVRCDLGRDVQTTLYRIAQEALTNVSKHAHAAKVCVTVCSDGTEATLEIVDDGTGFAESEAAAAAANLHVGLTLMRERVERAGGAWRLTTSPGEGTVVRAVLPV
ncbi:MAG: sensor histidine kinase, partial [Actinomycetota bacterium]